MCDSFSIYFLHSKVRINKMQGYNDSTIENTITIGRVQYGNENACVRSIQPCENEEILILCTIYN